MTKNKCTTTTTKVEGNALDLAMLVANVPTNEEWKTRLEVEEFLEANKSWKERVSAWDEDKTKVPYLVLQHCSPELKTELKNSTRWKETTADRSIVQLLLSIRDIPHNKK